MVRQAQMTESKRVKDFRLGLATQIPKFPNNRASLRVLQGQAAWAAADRLRQLAHQIGSAAFSREGHRSPRSDRVCGAANSTDRGAYVPTGGRRMTGRVLCAIGGSATPSSYCTMTA
jgi:hypothetical protein